MKNILLLFVPAVLLVSCGQPEPEPAPTSSNPMNTIINKGLNEAVNEANEQQKDTSSLLHQTLDTLDDVLKDNQEAINNGLNELKKAF